MRLNRELRCRRQAKLYWSKLSRVGLVVPPAVL